MATEIGRLRHRVEIQALPDPDAAPDANGEPTGTYATEATRWAAIEDQGGRELWRAQQVQPEVNCVVTLRHYPGLTAKHRFKHGDRILNIAHVMEGDRRGDWMTVACIEADPTPV